MPSPQNYFGIPPGQPDTSFFNEGTGRANIRGMEQALQRQSAINQFSTQQAATAQALRAAEFSRAADEQALLVVPMIQELDPSADDYITKRASIESSAPFAAMSAPVRNLFGVKDNQFRNAQYQLRTQMSERRGAGTGGGAADRPVTIVEALRAGITVDEIEKLPKGEDGNPHPVALTQVFGQRKSSGSGGGSSKDVTADFYEKRVAAVKDRVAAVEKLLDRDLIKPEDERVIGTFNELETLLKEQDAYLRGKINPPLPGTIKRPAAQVGEVGEVVTPVGEPPAAPEGVSTTPPKKILTPAEIDKSISGADDMALSRIGADIEYPLEARVKALEKLKASVTPMKNLSINEQEQFDANKKKLIGQVEETIRKDKFVIDKLNPAWMEEKSKLEPTVAEFAKRYGKSVDNLYNSILKLEKIKVTPEDAKHIPNARLDLDGKWYAYAHDAVLGKVSEDKNTRLMHLNGEQKGGSGLGSIAMAYANHLLGTNVITNAGVLRALAQQQLNSGGNLVPTKDSPTGAIPDAKQASFLEYISKTFGL